MSSMGLQVVSIAAIICLFSSSLLYAQQTGNTQKEKLKNVVEDAASDSAEKGAQIGEASYNIANCRALIDAEGKQSNASEGNASIADGNVEKLDLDKCRALVK